MALDTANLCILTGNANPDLAKKIADHIGVNLCDAYVGHFNNGETQVMIEESVRGTLAEVLAHFTETEPRGEFVIVVEGYEAPKKKKKDTKHDAE